MPSHAVAQQPEHDAARARALATQRRVRDETQRRERDDSDASSDGARTPPAPRDRPPVPSPRNSRLAAAERRADAVEAENAMLKAALAAARTKIHVAAVERDALRDAARAAADKAQADVASLRAEARWQKASLDTERAELREASYARAALLRRSEPHTDLAEALQALETMRATTAARDARDAASKTALHDEVSALQASGRAAARLQADLAAAHAELEAERRGASKVRSWAHGQLDQLRAAKEEACAEAAAASLKCGRLEQAGAASAALEGDLAASRKQCVVLERRLDDAVANLAASVKNAEDLGRRLAATNTDLASTREDNERLTAATAGLKRDLASSNTDLATTREATERLTAATAGLKRDLASSAQISGDLERRLAAVQTEGNRDLATVRAVNETASEDNARLASELATAAAEALALKRDLVRVQAAAHEAADARDAAIANTREAAKRFGAELAVARARGDEQAALDARSSAELRRDLVAAKAALDVARTPPASPNPRLAQLAAHAEAAAEARDAAVAESITLRKKLSMLEVEKDELHAARDTAAGRTANLQRSIISLKAEVATSQQHGADRLAALAEEHTHRLGDETTRGAALRRELAGSVADRDDLRASLDMLKRRADSLETQLREERDAADVVTERLRADLERSLREERSAGEQLAEKLRRDLDAKQAQFDEVNALLLSGLSPREADAPAFARLKADLAAASEALDGMTVAAADAGHSATNLRRDVDGEREKRRKAETEALNHRRAAEEARSDADDAKRDADQRIAAARREAKVARSAMDEMKRTATAAQKDADARLAAARREAEELHRAFLAAKEALTAETLSLKRDLVRVKAAAREAADAPPGARSADAPPPPPALRSDVATLQREVARLTEEADGRRTTSFVETTRLKDEADGARAVASDLRDDLRAAEGQRDDAVDAARRLERDVSRLERDVARLAGEVDDLTNETGNQRSAVRDALGDRDAAREAAVASDAALRTALDAARQGQTAAEGEHAAAAAEVATLQTALATARATADGGATDALAALATEALADCRRDVSRLETDLAAARKAAMATAERVRDEGRAEAARRDVEDEALVAAHRRDRSEFDAAKVLLEHELEATRRERDVALAACSEANGELRALKLKHELEAELEAVRTPPRNHGARADRAEGDARAAEAREAAVRAELAALRRARDELEAELAARAPPGTDGPLPPPPPAAAAPEAEALEAPQTPPRSRGLRRRVAALAEERDELLANAAKRIAALKEQLARVTRERDAARAQRPARSTRGRASQTKASTGPRARSAPTSPREDDAPVGRGTWRRAEDELTSLRQMLEDAAASEARAVTSLKRDLAVARAELDILRTPVKNPTEAALAAETRRRELVEAELVEARHGLEKLAAGEARAVALLKRDLAATKASLAVHAAPTDTSVVKRLRDALHDATAELDEARSAARPMADELEACRRAHAAEKRAVEDLKRKVEAAAAVRTPPHTPPRAQRDDLKHLRTELEHARAALTEAKLKGDHTEESHVKSLQHDLRHAGEELQHLHDALAAERTLRAESEEALRAEQGAFAEAEMALRGRVASARGALEAERALRAAAEASLKALRAKFRGSSEQEASLRIDLAAAADALSTLDDEHRAEGGALQSNLEALHEIEASLRGELAHAHDALQAERSAWTEVEQEVAAERAQWTEAEDQLLAEVARAAAALDVERAARGRTEAALAEAVRPRTGAVERLETHLVDLASAATDEVDAHCTTAKQRDAELQRVRRDHAAQAERSAALEASATGLERDLTTARTALEDANADDASAAQTIETLERELAHVSAAATAAQRALGEACDEAAAESRAVQRRDAELVKVDAALKAAEERKDAADATIQTLRRDLAAAARDAAKWKDDADALRTEAFVEATRLKDEAREAEAAHAERVTELAGENDALRIQADEQTKRVAALGRDLAATQAEAARRLAELDEAEAASQSAARTVATLRTQVSTVAGENDALRAACTDADRQAAEQRRRVSALEADTEANAAKEAALRRRVAALEGDLSAAVASHTPLKARLASATDDHEELGRKLAAAARDRDAFARRVASLEAEADAQTQEATGLRRKVSALESDKGALGVAAEARLAQLEGRRAASETRVVELQRAAAASRERERELAEFKRESEQASLDRKAELDALTGHAGALEADRDEAIDEASVLQQDLVIVSTERVALRATADELRTAAEEREAKHEAQRRALGVAAEARLAQLEAKRAGAEATCAALRQTAEQLRRDRAAADERARATESSLARDEALAEAEARGADLRRRVARLAAENGDLQTAAAASQRRLQALEAEVTLLGDGPRELQELRKQLRALGDERDAQGADARKQLNAMTRERDEAREGGDGARAALRRKLGVAEAEAADAHAAIAALRGDAKTAEAALAQLRRELADQSAEGEALRRELTAAVADARALAEERDELAQYIADADAVAATLWKQVADLGTERDAHAGEAQTSRKTVARLEKEAEAAADVRWQLLSLKTDRDDLKTMSDARTAALHRRIATLEAELGDASRRVPPLRAAVEAAEDAARTVERTLRAARQEHDEAASAFRRQVATLEARLTRADATPHQDQLHAEGRLLSVTHERDEVRAQHEVLSRRAAALEAALQDQRDQADSTTQRLRREVRALENERDDAARQKDALAGECGTLADERDRLLHDADAVAGTLRVRIQALTDTDDAWRRRVAALEAEKEALAQERTESDPVRERAEAAQLQNLAAATEASEAALLRLKADKRELLERLAAQKAQLERGCAETKQLRGSLTAAETTAATLYARLTTLIEERDALARASDRAAAAHRKRAAELEAALHETPQYTLQEIAGLKEANNELRADGEAREAALAHAAEVHARRVDELRATVAALQAERDEFAARVDEAEAGPCAHCYAVADERDQLLNDADAAAHELHARVAQLTADRDDALRTSRDAATAVARLEAEAEAAAQRSAALKAQLAAAVNERDEAAHAQDATRRALRRRVAELEAAAELDAHEAEGRAWRLAELEENARHTTLVRTPPRARAPSPETAGPVPTPTRTAIEALVDAETAATARARDLQLELSARNDDALRLRRELEGARADAEKARSDAERDCERTMNALRREAASAKDERVRSEEAHQATRRRLEAAVEESHSHPQDAIANALASERIQRLEADLALKTRAGEEAVAQASQREQGATVQAHAAKAALAETGARLQRVAARVRELVDLEVVGGKGPASPEGRTELHEVEWRFDDAELRCEDGLLANALETARGRALREAAKACEAVTAPSVKALTELICRTLPARRRSAKPPSPRANLERELAAARAQAESARREAADAVGLASESSAKALRDVEAVQKTLEAEADLRDHGHKAQLDQLRSDAASAEATHAAQVAHLDGELAALRKHCAEQVAHLGDELDHLHGQDEALQTQVAQLQGERRTLESELEAVHADAEDAEQLMLVRCHDSKQRAVRRALKYAEATIARTVDRLRRATPPTEERLPESALAAVLAAAEIDRPSLIGVLDALKSAPRRGEAAPSTLPDLFERLNFGPVLENASAVIDPAILSDASRVACDVLRAALREAPITKDDGTILDACAKVLEDLKSETAARCDDQAKRLQEVLTARDAAVASVAHERGLLAAAAEAHALELQRREHQLRMDADHALQRGVQLAAEQASTERNAHWERRWEVAAAEQAARTGELVRRLHASVQERNEAVEQVRAALRAARAAQRAVEGVAVAPADAAAELARATSDLADARCAAVAASKAATAERDECRRALQAAEKRRIVELAALEDEWRDRCAEKVMRAEASGEERLQRRLRQAQEDLAAARTSSNEAITAAHGRGDERLARETSMRLAAENEAVVGEQERLALARAKDDAERLLAKGLEDLEAVIQDRDARLVRASEAAREAAAEFDKRLADGAAAAEAAELNLREVFDGQLTALNEALAAQSEQQERRHRDDVARARKDVARRVKLAAAHAHLQEVARTETSLREAYEDKLRQVLDRDIGQRATQTERLCLDRPAQTQIYGLEVVVPDKRRRKRDALDQRFAAAAAARAAAEAKAAQVLRAAEERFADQLAALRAEHDAAALKAKLATERSRSAEAAAACRAEAEKASLEVASLTARLEDATAKGERVAALQQLLEDSVNELNQAKADAAQRGDVLKQSVEVLETRLTAAEEDRATLEVQAEEVQSANEHLQLNLSVARRDAEMRRQVHEKSAKDLQVSLRASSIELERSLKAEAALERTVEGLQSEVREKGSLKEEIAALRSQAEASAADAGRLAAQLKRDLAACRAELAVSSKIVPESPMVKRRLARLEGELAEALDGIETARDELDEAKRRFKKALDAAEREREKSVDNEKRNAEEAVRRARATAEASVAVAEARAQSARREAADAVRLARGAAEQAARDVDDAQATLEAEHAARTRAHERQLAQLEDGRAAAAVASEATLARLRGALDASEALRAIDATPPWKPRVEAAPDSGWRGSDDGSPVWRGDEGVVVAGLRRELAAARNAAPAAVASLRVDLDGVESLASPRSETSDESPAVASLRVELEAARAALTDQRLRGDPAEDDAVARLREALGRRDDQLEVLEDEVSRCRADVERRRGVEDELRRQLAAPARTPLPETPADGASDLAVATEALSAARRTIASLETAAAQDEAALEAYPAALEAAQDAAAAALERVAALEAELSTAREEFEEDVAQVEKELQEAHQRAAVSHTELSTARAAAEEYRQDAEEELHNALERVAALEAELSTANMAAEDLAEARRTAATLRGERDEARRALDEATSAAGRARGDAAKALDDLEQLQGTCDAAVDAQATDALRVGRLEAALEQSGSDLVAATATAARAEGTLARRAAELARLGAALQQKEKDATEATQRFDAILATRDADDREAVGRLQKCLQDREHETSRVLVKARATEAQSARLQGTLAAAEANGAAYAAKYHLLEARTAEGSARVQALEERMAAQTEAVAAVNEERDRALVELRKARDAALEATPLALAGSRRDNTQLRRALQQARGELQLVRRRPPGGISEKSRHAAEALQRELGVSLKPQRVDALQERIARLEAERDALRRKLAARPQASVELNALRAEVQAARDETVRARTDLAAGGDVRGRLAAAEDRAGTLASLNAGLVRKCERLLGAPQGGSL